MESNSSPPLELFYCYARKDQALRDELDIHLAGLRRSGLITAWYDGELLPGTFREQEIKTHLETARIILLLVSPDFLSSEDCYSIVMADALKRHQAEEAHVIPILLRPADWASTPLRSLRVSPPNALPVTLWTDRDEAFEATVQDIRKVANGLLSQSSIPLGTSMPIELTQFQQTSLPHSSPEFQSLQPSQYLTSRRMVMIGLAGAGIVGGTLMILGMEARLPFAFLSSTPPSQVRVQPKIATVTVFAKQDWQDLEYLSI